MELPPGPVFVAQTLLLCLPYSLLAYGLLNVLVRRLDIGSSVPGWSLALASLFARPAYLVASEIWSRIHSRLDARARGAVMPPQVKDKWPGGLSLLSELVKSFKHGYPGDILSEWSQEYGNTYSLNLIAEKRLFTYEPDHVKAILATQFEDFEKGPILYSQFHSLLGTGVFNSDGEMWKFHRSMTRPFFSKERISRYDIFEAHADDAIHQAKKRLAEGYPIDFQDLVSRFTLDSATEFLFSNDVHSLSAGLPYPRSSPLHNSPSFLSHPSNTFVNAFIRGQTRTALRTRYGPNWPLYEFWKDEVKPCRQVVDKFVEPILQEAVAKFRDSDLAEKDKESTTLLDHLVSNTRDQQVLKDELINLLVAARDTTASLLTFSVYVLTQRPDIAYRLREEMIDKIGVSAKPTYENIRDMKYLRAFLNEVLRLYPPVPFDGRTATRATILPSKTPGSQTFYVPAGTKCTYGVFLIHRRKDLWGPDADEFDPDRFIDERLHKYLTPNPYIFVPFNAGPRICLGQQFAYQEASYFLIRLLQTFSTFELAQDAQPDESKPPASWKGSGGTKGRDKVWFGTHLTMYVKGGLWVRMGEID